MDNIEHPYNFKVIYIKYDTKKIVLSLVKAVLFYFNILNVKLQIET